MTAATRVLLVDDHEMVLQGLRHRLDAEPTITVAAAVGSVEAAVATARTHEVDVAVVDYVLADGDGIDLAVRLLDQHPGLRVLLLSGTGDERILVRAIEAGCSGCLTKDQALGDLVRAITAVAAGEGWLPQSLLPRLFPRLQRAGQGAGPHLTARETEVLERAAEGLSTAAIADTLYLSVNTVRNHMQNAISKLGAHSRLEAVAVAVREGIIAYPK